MINKYEVEILGDIKTNLGTQSSTKPGLRIY